VAVDGSNGVSGGDIYVVDSAHHLVDKFNAAGEFVCEITGQPSSTAPLAECANVNNKPSSGVPGGSATEFGEIAVNGKTGEVYVDEGESVDVFGAEGEYLNQITGLSEPRGVAVDDASGDVYIAERGTEKVVRYEPGTAKLTTFAEGFGNPHGLAVDNSSGATAGDVYVVDRGNNVVDRFNKAGGEEGQLAQTPRGPFEGLLDVAVDPGSGDVYLEEHGTNVVAQFSDSGKFLGEIHAGGSTDSVAVAPTGDVYVADGENKLIEVFGLGVNVPNVKTGAATNVQGSSATVEGTVNPEEVALGECSFEYETSQSGTLSAPCEPSAANVETTNAEHTVTAKLVKLEPGTTYLYRLHAAYAHGVPRQGKNETLETLPAPSIESAVAKNVAGEAALLEAVIDPNGYETKYRFEYGTSTAYGTSVPATGYQILAAGTTPVTETLQLTGLKTGETYHWRIVAINANGTAKASSYDHTFVYDTSSGGLPDGRAYEMVTPAQKNGALILDTALGTLEPEFAADGSRVIAPAIQCFANAESCNTIGNNQTGSAYAFNRTSSGWQATALAPPPTAFGSITPKSYNADAGAALFVGPTGPGDSQALSLRESDGAFTELATLDLNGEANGELEAPVSTEDFSHIVWVSGEPYRLFEYVAGVGGSQPLLVGVSGHSESSGLISQCEDIEGGLENKALKSSVSSDGRVVFFVAVHGACATPPVNELYARIENGEAGARTVAISEPQAPQIPGGPGPRAECTGECAKNTESPAPPATNPNWRPAEFQGASTDGSRVFFTSAQQLTDAASENSNNLYEFENVKAANASERTTVDVSEGEGGVPAPGGPRVQGVMAVSEDGSHVYFVAQGVLTNAANDRGQTAHDGADNLYVYERDAADPAGRTAFIAALPSTNGGQQEWTTFYGGGHRANVTPDGRFLVFLSAGQLTADDTSRSGAKQVFRYDADPAAEEAAAHVPRLIRISIGNYGFDDNGNRSTATPCNIEQECSEEALLAPSRSLGGRRDPTMSDNGEYVFFQSSVGLTPQALDDTPTGSEEGSQGNEVPAYAQNVYEWHAGHVSLISDGRDVSSNHGASPECVKHSSVCLLGVDATGTNVFFTTTDQLVPQDTDTELDIYDARIGGGFPAPPAPQPCVEETCHGTPAAQLAPASGGTLTFNGQGNIAPLVPSTPRTLTRVQKLTKALRTCKKLKVRKKRQTCEKQARRTYGPKVRAKKINRRAGR
jgi:hypothetical protein